MKSQHAAQLNALFLIMIGLWGYAANDFAIHTVLVPLIAGIGFYVFSYFLKNEHKKLLLMISFLCFILILAFSVPFLRNAEQGDFWGMTRVGLEMTVTAMALIVYLRNFIQTRKLDTPHA